MLLSQCAIEHGMDSEHRWSPGLSWAWHLPGDPRRGVDGVREDKCISTEADQPALPWCCSAKNCKPHAADALPRKGQQGPIHMDVLQWCSGSDPWQMAKGTGCWLSSTEIADVHILPVHSNPNFQGGEEQAGSRCQSKDQLLNPSGSSLLSSSSSSLFPLLHILFFPHNSPISVGTLLEAGWVSLP